MSDTRDIIVNPDAWLSRYLFVVNPKQSRPGGGTRYAFLRPAKDPTKVEVAFEAQLLDPEKALGCTFEELDLGEFLSEGWIVD